MQVEIQFALDTFGDVAKGDTGALKPHDAVIRDVIEEAVLADQVGVDFFGLGEHHRSDFAISSPEVILGAIAARTTRLRLGTAVTILSSDDPVRVFQRFSTLNALSGGRAEVILGRGSFTESFPLFGLDLNDYERLFNEKLDLFARLLQGGSTSWSGTIRPPLRRQTVTPLLGQPLTAWVGVGGTPESVMRAVNYGLPMMLAIIGGAPARFRPFVDLYQRAFSEAGEAAKPVGVHSPGHVGATDAEARDEFWPYYQVLHNRLGRERGWPPIDRARFDAEVSEGALCVGSPETVARKIAATVRMLSLARFEMKYATGPMPHAMLMRSIELYGTRVIPRVREILAEG